MQKKINKFNTYEAVLEISSDIEGEESFYKMKESYTKDEKSIVKIIEPKKNKGVTLEYLDEKIIINNSAIEQSITLEKKEDLNSGFLIKDIFENMNSLKLIGEERIGNKEYYIFDYPINIKNKYTDRRELFIDKKTLMPFKLDVLDRKGNIRTSILYKNIKFQSQFFHRQKLNDII